MLFDYPPALPSNPAVLKYFPKKMPSKRKRTEKKSERRGVGGGKAKGKSQDCCVTFKPTLNIFLKWQKFTSMFIFQIAFLHKSYPTEENHYQAQAKV